MRARDLMTTSPVCVTPRTRLGETIEIMYANDVRHIPVVDDTRLVGIVSDRDLRALWEPVVNAQIGDGRAFDRRVADYMSTDPVTVMEEDDATEVIELLVEHRIGAIPVIDADGVLVGIVSYIDVLKALGDALEE